MLEHALDGVEPAQCSQDVGLVHEHGCQHTAILGQRFLGTVAALGMVAVALPRAADQIRKRLRDHAVKEAWKQEMELVRITRRGTREWSKSELECLKHGKKPELRYEGHHINSVGRFLQLAGNPDNIFFALQPEHYWSFHDGNTHKATSGKMLNRKSLMVQWSRHK